MKKLNFIICLAVLCMGFVYTGCKQNADINDYFSVKSDPKGIKITFGKKLIFQENAGSTVSVDGCPFKIGNLHANKNKKEYIYPFTESGKTYKVRLAANISTNNGKTYRWVETVKECKAGGGTDYKQYINLQPILNAQLEFEIKNTYSGLGCERKFTFDGTQIIKDSSKVAVKIPIEIILGEKDWSNTKWYGFAGTIENEDIKNLSSFTNGGLYVGYSMPEISDFEWKKYDYKYAAYATPLFVFT